jgi:hypothetical protein
MLRSFFNGLARRMRYAQIVRNRRNAALDAAFHASLPRPGVETRLAPHDSDGQAGVIQVNARAEGSVIRTITKGGHTVHLESVGADGRIYGSKSGLMPITWWHADGRHNAFRDLDLHSADVPVIKELLANRPE